ncbi:hypothetical protein [Streptomyces sp. cmx-18-6]|uniref:hypothetical protein n=1 Tax=Streptomyces sp. cmx-18-6 TaxID=2790930 RepID=UPI00397F02AA
MKRALAVLSVTAAALGAAGAVAPTAVAASAGPCKTWVSATSPYAGSASCGNLTTSDGFRARVVCVAPQGATWTVYGPWKKGGQTSTATCPDRAIDIKSISVQVSP